MHTYSTVDNKVVGLIKQTQRKVDLLCALIKVMSY